MDWLEVLLRLGIAAIIGAAIGLDREVHRKAAGVRTISLVSLGAAIASMSLWPGDVAAHSRVIQGIVTGIGFLGGGVIVHHRGNVDGLTTAAAIWTAAALGAAASTASWPVVLIGAILVLVLLVLGHWLEQRLEKKDPRT